MKININNISKKRKRVALAALFMIACAITWHCAREDIASKLSTEPLVWDASNWNEAAWSK